VSAQDLVDLARGPKRAVTVAVDDLRDTVSEDGAVSDATDDSDSDDVRQIVVRGPRHDDSDRAGRDFARQIARQWSGHSANSGWTNSGRANWDRGNWDRADSGRGDCGADGGRAYRGRRISNPFLASQTWRGGSESSWASHYGAGDSMGSRDYVGRHRAG
jgi:hypothetical protein